MERETETVRTTVVMCFGIQRADASKQAGEQGTMERVGAAVVVGRIEPQPLAELFQLMREIAPFAHLRIGEVGFLGEGAGLGLRERRRFRRPPPPELERAEEVGARHAERGMGLRGLFALIDRPALRIVA